MMKAYEDLKGRILPSNIFHCTNFSTNFIPMAIRFVLLEILLVETVQVGDPLYLFYENACL